MKIILVGMMGSGKSSVGKSLAKALAYQFVDTDTEIEKQVGKSIPEIFEEEGEEAFRDIEKRFMSGLLVQNKLVIATGGGLPCFNNQMEFVNQLGLSIYLKAEPAFLTSRLINKKKKRPLISEMNEEEMTGFLKDLLSKRKPVYEKAQLHINAMNVRITELTDAIKSIVDNKSE